MKNMWRSFRLTDLYAFSLLNTKFLSPDSIQGQWLCRFPMVISLSSSCSVVD